MRRTVIIPANGVSQSFPITGRSVIIEACNLYKSINDVPLIGFDSGENQNPIYPRSTYQYDQGKFNKVVITGTAESAGDEITFLTFNECLDSNLNIEFSDSYKATLKDTFTKVASDTAQSITELELINSAGELPKAVYVSSAYSKTVPNDGIKYAFGANPVQGDNESGYMLKSDQGEPFKIVGINFILAFKFIAQTTGETPLLVITCEY